MSARYRIVTDRYCGYEVQAWRWWFPFWIQCGWTNTHPTVERAEAYAKTHARSGGHNVVKVIGRIGGTNV